MTLEVGPVGGICLSLLNGTSFSSSGTTTFTLSVYFLWNFSFILNIFRTVPTPRVDHLLSQIEVGTEERYIVHVAIKVHVVYLSSTSSHVDLKKVSSLFK